MNYEAAMFILHLLWMVQIAQNEAAVKTTTGKLRGIRLNVLGKEIDAYLGIPYAIPPVGYLRFRKPIPIKPWQNIFNATKKSPSCPQSLSGFETAQWLPEGNINEDCLYLNIWVPLQPTTGKATIVWIHGGGFIQGSSNIDLYDGQILASQGNVIVASMNYRLGAFGFLYLGTDDAPGNVGLHDQLLAILWIKDNLRSFGGDPSLITLSGQSAGAMSTCFHLLSPLSRGLANRAILESGSAYNNIFVLPPIISKIITAVFSARIGCEGNLRKPNKMLRCLRSKSAEMIYGEEAKMLNETYAIFVPRYGDDFLPHHPTTMIENGNFRPADMLIGVTADEGSMFVALRNWTLFFLDKPQITKNSAEFYINDLLRYNFEISLDVVLDKYVKPVSEHDGALLLKSAYRAVGAAYFVCPSIFISEKYSTNNNVYFYHYTHRSSQPWLMLREWMGVHHLQEIPFVFGEPLRNNTKYLENEIQFSADIIEAWSSFAKNRIRIRSMNYEAAMFILHLLWMVQIAQNEAAVKTTTGKLRGIRLNVLGKEIDAYLGIPYAIPPVGHLRFRKPIPIKPWQNIFNATKKSPSCPQSISGVETAQWLPEGNINEDCLYLNIWVPLQPTTGKATIVWIHGGGFIQGSSNIDLYDGQILASQGNVIVASMNYRLGAFGFLYLGTDDAPGNVGLHDQLLAILWIKENLWSFGGDPSLLTLSGQSAGAMSACFHLLSPLSRGLADRAILESGSAYNIFLVIPSIMSKIVTATFSARMGCEGSLRKPKKILRCLRSKSAEEIYIEEVKMLNETFIAFVPQYGDDFLPYHPTTMIENGNFRPADMLIGVNADEGSLFVAFRNWTLFFLDKPQITRNSAEFYINDLLRYNFEISLDVVLDKYIKPVSEYDGALLLKAAYRAVGAAHFVCPSIFISEKHSTNNNVYFYHYTHRSSQPWFMSREWMGVHHLQEIPFVFGEPLRNNTKYLEDEIQFSADIIEAWSSFAKNRVPHYARLSGGWPKFSVQNGYYVELNPYRVSIGRNLRKDECDLWRQGTT